jgi:hypothetical protein
VDMRCDATRISNRKPMPDPPSLFLFYCGVDDPLQGVNNKRVGRLQLQLEMTSHWQHLDFRFLGPLRADPCMDLLPDVPEFSYSELQHTW